VTDPAPAPIEAEPKKPTRRDVVAKLAGVLEHADPGTLAALRRADPTSPPAAFYRVAGAALDEHIGEGGPLRDRLESGWTVILSAMARAQGFLGTVPLGEALAKAGVAEMRVLRLMEAPAAQLPDLVRNVVHLLVQKGQRFDPNDLANLVLARDDDRGPRRNIARSYYRHADT
jgi:CRISPR-associated protein Cse2 (CRISPR_cse2)